MSRYFLKIVIVGVGIGGFVVVVCLKVVGFEVEFYEWVRELCVVGLVLLLMFNVLIVLERVGVCFDFICVQVFDLLWFFIWCG